MDDLKNEISSLRDQLHQQIRLFTQERIRLADGNCHVSSQRPAVISLERGVEPQVLNAFDNDCASMSGSMVILGDDRLI